VKRYRKADNSYIGLKNSKDEITGKFRLETTPGPYEITGKIIFLGEIPRLTDFESQSTSFVFDDGSPDFVIDDSALAMITDKGIFVVTGCGHAGIVNTLEHAKKVTGIDIINGIMGGFHLKNTDQQTIETISYLKENKVEHVYPSHCTDLPALSAFYDNFGMALVKTGNIYHF
jgi:7,8-dihydropterin-6-yl-methyl-4-(beta-D-ribofuranosyl)aminobenzene 5'-phosphate synthase